MKKKSFLTLFLLQSILLFSQGVGISDNGVFPLNNLTGMGQDALANTGSGGGGAGGRCQPGVEQGYSGQRGGNGGSGIVIIRYPVSNPNPN